MNNERGEVMAKKERTRNLVVRLSEEEIFKLHALADDADSSISDLVRNFLTSAFFAKWGAAPPPKAKLKFRPRSA